MFQVFLMVLTVVLAAELIVNVCLSIRNDRKMMNMIREFYTELDGLIKVYVSESRSQRELIEKIGEDVLYIKGNSEEVFDTVDKAAKQYQEEISSLFSYCGHKE